MQPIEERAAIAALGPILGPDVLQATYALYREAQDRLASAQPPIATDLSYGPHPRQRLDLYAPTGADTATPVLLWVHGGGFIRGDKGSAADPFNAHVGRWAARHGMLGAVMNYRLAPDHGWPSGGEDVGAAIDWLRAHAAEHGGDPERIVVAGTSAGAVHVATHLALRNDGGGAGGAILLSGLYGFTLLDERDTLYYGARELYPERRPLAAVVASPLPLFVAGAQFDPPRFQAELVGLLGARLDRHGVLPRSFVASGHNHFSLAYHLGTADTRLSDELLDFIDQAVAFP